MGDDATGTGCPAYVLPWIDVVSRTIMFVSQYVAASPAHRVQRIVVDDTLVYVVHTRVLLLHLTRQCLLDDDMCRPVWCTNAGPERSPLQLQSRS